jgi:kumamolisin
MNVPAGHQALEGSERQPAASARRLGPADPDETVTVTIRVRRRSDAPALPGLDDWAATPPARRTFLSREDFARRYGADQADLDRVAAFAQAQGLGVVETDTSRRVVVVSGTVAQMNDAFGVELGRYESPTETYRGREGPVHLPADISEVVEGVFGLDNRRMARRAMGAPPGTGVLSPPQVAGLYNFPSPPPSAASQTIGLLEFSGPTSGPTPQSTCGFTLADIQAFFPGLGLGTPTIASVGVDGAANAPSGDPGGPDLEVALDIDVAGSVGQGANIAVYFAPWTEQGWVDAVTTAVHDTTNAPSVLSISWGWAENNAAGQVNWTPAAISAVNATFQEAAMMGVTVLAASGDDGSNDQIGDGRAHVDYPASDPAVTTCGGTIIENAAGSTFTEGTWNDSSAGGGVTGGGISDIFGCTTQFPTLPVWQSGVGVPPSVNDGHQGRGIPDVAGNASPFSGYNITADGVTQPIGGTSGVAPLYAGLVALLNANLGKAVGYLNPTLYSLGTTGVFRDIADGVSNATEGAPGYTSVSGWDACTGFGSVDGQALLTALRAG